MALQRTITRVKMALEDLLIRKVFGESKVSQVRQLNTINLTAMQLATTVDLTPQDIRSAVSGDWWVIFPRKQISFYPLPYYWIPFSTASDDNFDAIPPLDLGNGRWRLAERWYMGSRGTSNPGTSLIAANAVIEGLTHLTGNATPGGVVTLEKIEKGGMRRVTNRTTANYVVIYPHLGGRINDLPTGANYQLPAGESISFVSLNSVQWTTFKSVY